MAASDVRFILHFLSQAVTVACIDKLAGTKLMLHACAIGDPDSGRALAVVAASGTGKTTFATTMGPGRTYLTDETVCLTEDQHVIPYPKPLSVNSSAGFKDQVDPGSLGMLRPQAPGSLAGVWLLERTTDDVAPVFRRRRRWMRWSPSALRSPTSRRCPNRSPVSQRRSRVSVAHNECGTTKLQTFGRSSMSCCEAPHDGQAPADC